ncbi:hypothetical protein N431DRAFT_209529 [Stipitochalara longipes BDJ]|nr:hypothetical protein N431DRAFT_209529 [Stipitochalara longipes BDJ]
MWVEYSRAVKELLSNPKSRSWLGEASKPLFCELDLVGNIDRDSFSQQARTSTRRSFDEEAQNGLSARTDSLSAGWRLLHAAVNFAVGSISNSYNTSFTSTHNTPRRQNPPTHPLDDNPIAGHRSPSTLLRVWTLLFNTLFTPLATAVCILNIATALGYVMLMNNPSPPKSSYIIGILVTWFLTAAMMISRGIFTTGSMKDYARRLVILAMFTCFVVAVVFHLAGASNFASSFLVGITMVILMIQIW